MNFRVFSFLLTWAPLLAVNGLTCPEDDVIAPCTCADGSVRCEGPLVNQQAVTQTFDIIRDVNSLLPHQVFPITNFILHQTNMTQLDLTPLINASGSSFYITENSQLTTIIGPVLSNEDSIQLENVLSLAYNSLTDEGLGQSLKYFSPSFNSLYLNSNALQGSNIIQMENDFEFLPGLSKFTQLEFLFLSENQIKKISDGQFATLIQLQYLNLDFNKNLTIGENAFAFTNSTRYEGFRISIKNCDLYENTINLQENGLLNVNRPFRLYIGANNVEFLSAENFEMYLNADLLNQIDLYGKHVICDQRMKWIHDKPDLYFGKVLYALCENDPGYDVFSTSLIH